MRRALVVLVLTVCATGARADEVRLSLEECLARALHTATEIREGRLLVPLARTQVAEARSEFDHLLSFRTSGGLSKTPSGNFFAGAEEIREQTFLGSVGVSRKLLATGGTWTLGYDTSDLVTNNRFYNYRPQWTNALTFTFSQPLLRGGWGEYASSRTRLAESAVAAADSQYAGVLESTLSAVEKAYWQLVFLREDLEVKRQSERTAEELVRISRKRLDAGAGTRIELVQAEAGASGREKETILAEHRLANAEDALRAYVYPFTDEPGREIRIVPTDRVTAPDAPAEVTVGDRLRTAFDRRPDLRQVRADLEAAGIRVVQSENELLPRLDFYGTVGMNGLNDTISGSNRTVFDGDYPAWEIGLSLEVPLGNRGARARHRRALLDRSRAIARFETLRNRAVVEVRTAVRGIETAWREILAARKATAAARAQYEAEQDRLAAEKSTNYQLLEVEADLSSARSQELLSLVSYRLALVTLETATGTYLASRDLTAPPDADAAEEEATDAEEEAVPSEKPAADE